MRKDELATLENACILAQSCRYAGKPDDCHRYCAHYVAMHGMSGMESGAKSGRAGAAGLPDEYRLLTLANSPAREGQAEHYRRAFPAYVATFERQFEADGSADANKRIKSLYLWSESPGTGKTSTAAAILNEWLRVHYIGSLKRGKQPEQRPAYFLDVNEFQTEYNLAAMTDDKAEMERIKAVIKRSQSVPFLVMDDIGVRGSATDAFRAYVHAIINYRTTNGIPTVYTSNFPIEEMATVFDERLFDRIRDECAVIHFGGRSNRGGK